MTKNDKIKISQNVAVVTAILALLVSAIMLLNYWQFSQTDPLESEALKVLVERSFENPKDEFLKQDVRSLDLLARKAFFTYKWQIKTGSLILLIFAVVLIVSLRVYYSLTENISTPEKNNRNDYLRSLLSQKWILGIGGFVLILAIISGFLSQSHLSDYIPEKERLSVETSEELPSESE